MSNLAPLASLNASRSPRASRYFNNSPVAIFTAARSSLGALAVIVLCCFLSRPVSAASFSASLDRDSISQGETATLTLFFDGGEPKSPVRLPQVANLNYTYPPGRSVSQSFSFDGNGAKQSVQISYTYSVTPTQPGVYTIPAISVTVEGQVLTSQPLTLRVGKAATVTSENAFLKLIVPKTNVYLGEILPIEIQLFFQAARGLEAPHIKEEGFTLGRLVQGNESATVLNNRRYDVLPLKTYVIPVKAGTIAIGPATMDLQVGRPSSRVDFFGRPLMDFQPATLQSQPETLQVSPLPKDNVPLTFNGAVGVFTMNVTATPTNIAVGDPITVKVQISGNGALDAVTLPAQENWQQFKLYPPTSEFQPADQLGMSGTKTFSLTAVPQNLEIKELPSFTFSFFDPNQKSYRTLTQPAIPLVVRPSAASLPPPVLANNASPENQPANNDITPIKIRLGNVHPIQPPLAVQPWFVAVQFIPVITWLALLFDHRRRENLANNPRLRRRLQTAQIIRNGLKQLHNYANANQSTEFFSTLFHLLQERLGERLDLPASSITESIVDERLRPLRVNEGTITLVSELFQACNQARYARQSTNEELVSLIPKTEAALDELGKIKA